MGSLARRVLLLALAGSLLALGTGCGDGEPGAELRGVEWTLVSGVEAPPDAVPTLTFAEDAASGFGGCNTFTSDYSVEGSSISIGPIGTTFMACEEPQTVAEEAYLDALITADSWAVEDGELVLSAGGEEVLRFAGESA